MKKIDIFNHIWPTPFFDALIAHIGEMTDITRRSGAVPMMTDLDRRFEVMDMFGEDYMQVLSLASPPLEKLAGPDKALELSQIGSDSMAELCDRYPERFPGFIGTAALGNPESAVAEAKRAIEDLGACGMQIFTNVSGKPLDRPEFEPFFDYMASSGKPVWMHPARGENFSDYLTEDRSEYEIWWTFGWPYETSAAMSRIALSGMMDRLPEMKVVAHHLGAMVPYFEGRVGPGLDQLGKRTSAEDLSQILTTLKKRPFDYFKDFYADSAVFGSRAATVCGLEFYGVDKVLFASDCPFDPERGPGYIRETIKVLNSLDLPDEDMEKICFRNAQKMFRIE